jgi:hypothetical protein
MIWWLLLIAASITVGWAALWSPPRSPWNTAGLIEAAGRAHVGTINAALRPAACPYCSLPVSEPDPGWPNIWCPPDANGAPMHVRGPGGWV